jgi:IS30 family transposase
MGRLYEQLSLEERCEIARLRGSGASIRQIAAALDRQPSSISRELKRNAGSGPRAAPYKPAYAQAQTAARRWSGARLERDEALRDQVLGALRKGWSPEQVSGRLRREEGRPVIGHESIYRFIYAQLKRTNDGAWRFYLPRAKARRGRRGHKGGSPVSFIQQRVGIAERPAEALTREQPGHWEADCSQPTASRSWSCTSGPRASPPSSRPPPARPSPPPGRSAACSDHCPSVSSSP